MGTRKLFVYGTLLADEVVAPLLRRVPESRPAVLRGYRRHAIRGRVYPALARGGPDDAVEGR
eukprot:evm.model.scf_317.9 EVM.evm.TU.scf_317.9   scf_317:88290-88472(-)